MRITSLIVAAAVVGGSLFSARLARADGCFLCEGGGYVAFTGEDTFEKRKKATEQFGCKVSGTTSSCSHPKGTVSSLRRGTEDQVACEGEEHQKDKKGKKYQSPKQES
ncbi:MAG: hypothetical protein HY696_08750 [Deltaproteobacteria bacterium]|nr:hypothetical protein [Deltaproteobacteria bacterium]